MCPRSGNPNADPRKGPGRRSQWNQGHWMAKYGITSWLPGQESAAGMTNAYNTAGRRVTDGLMSIWWFTEGTGTIIEDRALKAKDTDLTILSGTQWTQDASLGNRYFLNLSAGGHVQASTDELYNAMKAKVAASATNEFTLEAWVKPTNVSQDGPARIMTLAQPANGTKSANFMIGQGSWGSLDADVYNTRLRVEPSGTDADGDDYKTAAGTATTNLQHLVYTVSGSPAGIITKLYVDSIEQINETLSYYGGFTLDTSINFLRHWTAGYNLDIGNTVITGDDRQWLGGIYLMSMYTRALLPGEVKTNYDAGVTTDSVLPLPSSQIDSPVSSTVYSDGSAVSIPFSVGGYRAASLTCTYSVTSTDLTTAEYTVDKDLTLAVGPTESGNTISITPLLDCSGDGVVSATLTSMSTGSPVAGQDTYTLYVSSMDVGVVLSGAGDRNIDTTLAGQVLPIIFNLDRKHRYDISATINLSANPGNTGSYALVSSTTIVPSGNLAYTPPTLSAQSPNLFVSGDSVRLSSTGASSDSILATITASMNEELTFTNSPAGDKPGPSNTGPRINEWDLSSPSNESWWDSAKNKIKQSNITIQGYRFGSSTKMSDANSTSHNVQFVDCLFDGKNTATDYLIKGLVLSLIQIRETQEIVPLLGLI